MTANRKTMTQQLNMSTHNSTTTHQQETDYSYPINTSASIHRQRNGANKFTDLRLQTAIDFQGARAVTHSSQNKNSVYSNALDYMMKQQQTIKHSNNKKGTIRYSNHVNRNQSISPRGSAGGSHLGNDSF